MDSNRLNDAGAALLRIALGVLYLAHVAQKLFVFTLPGTAQFFASVGLPGWLAYVTTFVELAGGLALLAGVRVRLVSLVLLPFMLGATMTHFPNGWSFAAPHGGWEYPAFWAVTLVVQALVGAGAFARGEPAERDERMRGARLADELVDDAAGDREAGDGGQRQHQHRGSPSSLTMTGRPATHSVTRVASAAMR